MNYPSPETSRLWLAFGTFRMDLAGQQLWAGSRVIPLRPKSWDVLRHLVERPGLLVTKQALHHEIWQDAAVSEDTLTQSILELRKALGDDARRPRFIETVHRRGFRFIAPISERLAVAGDQDGPPGSIVVGRQGELNKLHECLHRVCNGTRQVVFVTGEAGIGKTTLVEEFLGSPALRAVDLRVLHGQAVQQRGPREPYMPVLEALERELSAPLGTPLTALLRRLAPSWYAQMASLQPVASGPAPTGTPTVERMLREIATFLEAMAAPATIVLVLEDLHWSDIATADFLSFLAERRDPAKLLIIATYRPAEASVQEHPIREVKQSLLLHRCCTELALGYLSAADVREYVCTRFGDDVQGLAALIHRRTDGNPLFVVAMVEEVIRRGWLTEANGHWMLRAAVDDLDLAVPSDLREMISLQFQRFDAQEQSALEAASVVGVCFGAPMVAGALGRDIEDVEAVCQHLARSYGFLNVVGGTDGPADYGARPYGFAHALHRQVIYEQTPDARRRRLHQRIGEALEAALGKSSTESAAELSIHFERSGDDRRAVHYLRLCVGRAQQRATHREAVAFAAQALRLLGRVPESLERHADELEIRLLLNVSLNVTSGYRSAEVRENCERARWLCEQTGDARQLFEIVHALWYAQGCGPEAEGVWQSVEDLARIAEQLDDATFRRRAQLARGRTELWNGRFAAAVPRLTQFLADAEQEPVERRAATYGVDPVVAACTHSGLGLWFLGFAEQARARVRGALTRAEQTGDAFDLASGLFFSGLIELLCGNAAHAGTQAHRAAQVCADHDIAFLGPVSRFLCGAAVARQGNVERGLAAMRQSLIEQQAIAGAFFCDVMLGFIAAACGQAERWDEGLRRADEGIQLSETMLERIYVAELWRIKGDLLLGQARHGKDRRRAAGAHTVRAAQECFRHAWEIACAQRAQSLALRSAMNLARLPPGGDVDRDARGRLGSIYGSFTEGFETQDLKDATALLQELGDGAPGRHPAR